jgi:hypothetical protein
MDIIDRYVIDVWFKAYVEAIASKFASCYLYCSSLFLEYD